MKINNSIKNMIKAIFWDNDGTLVNTEPLFFEAYKQVLDQVGIKLTRDYYVNKQLKKNISILELARLKGLTEIEVENLKEEGYKKYSELLSKGVPVMKGVRYTLNKLSKKYLMGVVTSSRLEHFNSIMTSSGLSGFFDFSITREDVKHEKPSPESYLLAIKKTGFNPSECIAIEDSERGVVAAKAANLTCYAIPNILTRENDFSMSDFVLNSAEEIFDFL
jgi:HAD superfamily hydrolase (TIGR01509 family)